MIVGSLPGGTIVERRHWTIGEHPLNTALDRLMMQPQSLTHRKERGVLPVSQSIRARSTRLAGSVRERATETSLAKSSSPINNSIARRRAVMIFESLSRESKEQPTGRQRPNKILTKDRFHGIDELATGVPHLRAPPPALGSKKRSSLRGRDLPSDGP